MVGVDLTAFRELLTPHGERALASAAARGVGDGALMGTLEATRREFGASLATAAVTQARLRERARAKFGADADRMYFTADGVEQATRTTVATHRAGRYAIARQDARGTREGAVLDLCCGIGGDLIALARAGVPVYGVDRDPLTAEVARANAAALDLADLVEVGVGDAQEVDLSGWAAAFCDPARRGGGRRVFDPGAYSPPFDYLDRLAAAIPLTGAKVAPGIPHELVPAGVEAEWVSDGGEVKEAALWWGGLATARRRATLLPAGVTLTDRDDPGEGDDGRPAPVGPVGRYLYEPDGAVIRAHLVGAVVTAVDGWLVDPTIAYVSADAVVSTPFARAYEVTDVLPFSLKRLRALLRSRGVGSVTIKKRGSALDPAALRRDLRLAGDAHATVVLTRVAGAPTALLCTPVPAAPSGG